MYIDRMREDDQRLIGWYDQHKDSEDLKVLGSLIAKMKKREWLVHSFDDGDEVYEKPSRRFAKMMASNLDEYRVRFYKEENPGCSHTVLMINGNKPFEVISDWSFTREDPDGFDKAMDEVTDEIEKQYGWE